MDYIIETDVKITRTELLDRVNSYDEKLLGYDSDDCYDSENEPLFIADFGDDFFAEEY